MGAKYRIFPMRFNVALWRDVMRRTPDNMLETAAHALQIETATMRSWRNLKEGQKFQYPSMTNFINVCNVFDINPQDFFVLDDGGRDE